MGLNGPYINEASAPVVARIRATSPLTPPVTIPEIDGFEATLRPYQHSGVAMAYLTPRLLLADSVGLGKTVQSIGLMAMLKRNGHLSLANPAVVLAPAGMPLLSSWAADGFNTFVPTWRVAVLDGTVSKRDRVAAIQSGAFHAILLSYETFIRDRAAFVGVTPSVVVCDEASRLKSHKAQVSIAVKALTATSPRVLLLSATPIQNQLVDLHSQMEALNLGALFGTEAEFKERHYNFHAVKRHVRGRARWVKVQDPVNPYKALDTLRQMTAPYWYRRTYRDIPGQIPELTHRIVPLELSDDQREAYLALQRKELPGPGSGRRFQLQARAQYLKQCATSLQTLAPNLPFASSKISWLINMLLGDWSETKVVVYSTFRQTIVDLVRELTSAGIGSVVMAGHGDLPGGATFPYGSVPSEREPFRRQFFDDPNCRVCIGTSAIEMSVNLHAAPVLVNLDLPYNPARVEQIAGRIQRASSPYRFVMVFSLLSVGTVDEAVLALLAKRQEVADYMLGDVSALFGRLSDTDLEEIIEYSPASPRVDVRQFT